MADNKLYNILQSRESNFNSISEARAQFPMGDIVQQAAAPVYSPNYLADHANPNYDSSRRHQTEEQKPSIWKSIGDAFTKSPNEMAGVTESETKTPNYLSTSTQPTATGFGTGNFAGTDWRYSKDNKTKEEKLLTEDEASGQTQPAKSTKPEEPKKPNYGTAGGNIDLNDRPTVANPNFTYSTVDSFSTNIDGKEVLLPTVIKENGKWKHVSEEEALEHYYKTGEKLGVFNTPEEANSYAEALHNNQAEQYGSNAPKFLGQKDKLPDISNLSQLSLQQGPKKVGEQELVPGRADQLGYRATNTITGAGKQIGSQITSFAGTLAKNAGETMSKGTTNNLIWRQNGEGNPNSLNAKMAPSVDKFGSTVQATAEELGKSAQADIDQAKNGLSKFGQAGVDIATNVIQMGFDAAVGAVTGGASLASMFVRSAGGAMQKARSKGADTTQQTAYGLATGAIEVITEKLADGVAKIYGGGAADDIAEKLVRKFAKSDTGRTALRALYGMVSEGGEEVISDLLAPYAELLYNDKSFSDTVKNTFKGTYDPSELLYDFVIGFTIGGLGQGASIATGQSAQANAELRAIDTIQNNLVANGMDASKAGRAANILSEVAKGETISQRDSKFLDSVGGYNTSAPQASNPLVQNNAPEQQAETTPATTARAETTTPTTQQNTITPADARKVYDDINLDYGWVNTEQITEKIKSKTTAELEAVLNLTIESDPNEEDNINRLRAQDKADIDDLIREELQRRQAETPAPSTQPADTTNPAPSGPVAPANIGENHSIENGPQTQGTASEPAPQAETPTEQRNADTDESEELNSKPDEGSTSSGSSVPPGTPPQRPTGIKTDTDYQTLGEQYGTIEQGENPVRDSQTPKRTTPGSNVSESVRTVQEAEATPESRLQSIQAAVVDGRFSFVPIANSEHAATAEAKLKKDGWAKTLRDWTAAVRSGQASADLVAQGAVLLNNAGNNSECTGTEYIDLLSDYVQLTRGTAQALQAARILKTLSPEGRLYGVQRVVQNMNDKAKPTNGKTKNAGTDVSASTELENKYSIPETLIEEYRQQTTDEGRDAVIDKMQQAIADQIPSSLGDKFTAIRYLNMLGNFKTQVRNVAGNTGMMLVQKAKNTVRSTLETVASIASGGKYQKTYASLYNPRLIATAWNDLQSTSGLKDTAMGEKKYSSASTQFEKGIEEKRNPFKFGDNRLTRALGIANKQGPAGKLLSLYNKATSWAMEAGDDIFVSLNYTDALAGYLQAHKISADQWTALVAEADSDPGSNASKTVDDARAFAIKQAQEATFRDTNRISDFAQNFDRNWGKAKIITQGIAPFRKTPANVGVRMEEYSPLGLIINTPVKAIQAAKGSENVTGADVVDSLSKSLTGTGLAIVGFALAQAGRARTKSDDDKQEAFDKLRGLQDYSITVGDGLNLTLDWAVPASASIFMGVELFNLVRDGNISPNDAMKVIGNLTAPMLEMSMLSGVNDALNNISSFNEDTDALPQFLLNSAVGYLFQGLTNTLAGQFEQANEEYRQSYYTNPDNKILPTSVQKKLAQAGNKTPGIDWQASDYIDAWGRKQKNEGTTAQRYANALLNPSYTSSLSSKETAVDSELQRLYDYGKDIDGFPSVLPQTAKRNTTVNGTKLSPEEYETYAVKKGQESLRLVTNLIDSIEYKNLSDDGKAKAISECYSYAKYLADADISKRRKEESTNDSYYSLMTGVDKSGTQYDKTALNESNFAAYTAFKIGMDEAVKAGDYKTIDRYVSAYGRQNSNLQTVIGERNSVVRALSTWKAADLDSKTYYAVQRELVKSQQRLDKSQKTGSVVELDALANVNLPEATKKRLIDSLPDYGSKTVKGVYDILYDYGFNSKQINNFWTQSQDWVYKDTGDAQSSQKAGTLQPLEAYYAIEQLPGLTDSQKNDIYNQMKEVANVPYKINDWGNYTFGSERSYYQSGRSKQEFGTSTQTTQNPLYSSYSNSQSTSAPAAQNDDVLKAILSGK